MLQAYPIEENGSCIAGEAVPLKTSYFVQGLFQMACIRFYFCDTKETRVNLRGPNYHGYYTMF